MRAGQRVIAYRNFEGVKKSQESKNLDRPPTERQLEIAETMLRFFEVHGTWPTQREVAVEMGIKTNNMSPYFTALVKKGIAEKIPGRQHRSIGISKAGEDLIRSGWQPSLPL